MVQIPFWVLATLETGFPGVVSGQVLVTVVVVPVGDILALAQLALVVMVLTVLLS
jgi:hypothetical protein